MIDYAGTDLLHGALHHLDHAEEAHTVPAPGVPIDAAAMTIILGPAFGARHHLFFGTLSTRLR